MNPMYLLKAYVSHIRWVTLNKLPKHPVLRENIKYKDVHKGERCFILGSGHSILKQDLTKLRGEIVITQNHFHVHPDIDVIQPKYHCVVPMYQPPDIIMTGLDGLNPWRINCPAIQYSSWA